MVTELYTLFNWSLKVWLATTFTEEKKKQHTQRIVDKTKGYGGTTLSHLKGFLLILLWIMLERTNQYAFVSAPIPISRMKCTKMISKQLDLHSCTERIQVDHYAI